MKALRTATAVLIVVALPVVVAVCAKTQEFRISLAATILAALLIGLIFRVRMFFSDLKGIDGVYHPQSLAGELNEEAVTVVEFSPWNIVRLRPRLYLRAKSNRGSWESTIPVSEFGSLQFTGQYRYTESGTPVRGEPRGGQERDWGIHTITYSRQHRAIFVKAEGMNRRGDPAEFLLVRADEP